jgi:hypothetical protein
MEIRAKRRPDDNTPCGGLAAQGWEVRSKATERIEMRHRAGGQADNALDGNERHHRE